MFDLKCDPLSEQPNAGNTQPGRVAQLETLLAGVVADAIRSRSAIPTDPAPISPAVIERLRALGYLFGG